MNPSMEAASLTDAYLQGQTAGSRGWSRSLNPYQDDTQEYDAWDRGHMAGAAQHAARMVA